MLTAFTSRHRRNGAAAAALALLATSAALGGCGGEGATVRGVTRDAAEAAGKAREPASEINGAQSRLCRRVTLEKYRRTALQQPTGDTGGC